MQELWGSLRRPRDRATRGLAKFRADANDHLEARHDFADQSTARRAVCEAARTLQFMEATGLRPLTAYLSRLSHLGRSMPQRDHQSYWIQPDTGAMFAVDEPYRDPDSVLPSRQEWASKTGAVIAVTTWDGMYSPEFARLYLTSHDGRDDELREIVERLNAEPPPVRAEVWSGESVPYSPLFISPERARLGQAKRGRPTPKYVGMVRRRAIIYGDEFAPRGSWRPNAQMPLSAHKEAGNHLKELLDHGGLRSHAYVRVAHVRSELDEWVQREYRSRKELPEDVFFNLYYREWTPSELTPMIMVDRVEALLLKHYPDCVPRRDLIRCLTAARKDLSR